MFTRLLFVSLGLCIIHAQPDYLQSLISDASNLDPARFRLPDDVTPKDYTVHIQATNLDSNEFIGAVQATVEVHQAVDRFYLNGENMVITDRYLFEIGQTYVDDVLEYCRTDEELARYQLIECALNKTKLDVLTVGTSYTLILGYRARFGLDNRGLYKSHYTDDNGQRKTLLTTHFGQQARRLLPCWDEPRFKARFTMWINRNRANQPHSISVANINSTFSGTEYTDMYNPTAPIPPYILAVVISDFVLKSDAPRGEHRFGVFVRPNAVDQAEFAFEIGPVLMDAFYEWTGMNYYEFESVEKMEMAAIPDFSAGAMENWGLMIHREVNILYDEQHATTMQKQRIALVISHEVAHMWFGNLVTCDWWDVTWLNEGFARYFQFIGLDMAYDSYEGLLQFPVTTMQATMMTDATKATHPLTNRGKIFSYADIRTMFSTITYDKGGSILRMIHDIMGDEKFKAAIRNYLRNNAYKTATPEDLFTEFEKEYPNQNVVEILATFTTQPGVPLVTARRDGDTITLIQTRFWQTEIPEENLERWSIPITFTYNDDIPSNESRNYGVFRREEREFKFQIPESSDYYMINVLQNGYYRVNYDEENWLALSRRLHSENFGGIHVINRAQIIDDLFQLARAGYLTYDFIFAIIDFVRYDDHYLPWLATFNGLSYLQQRIPDAEYYEEFEWYIRWLVQPIYTKLGMTGPNIHLENLNRINVLNWACKYGAADCEERAREEFEKIQGEGVTNPDSHPAVFCSENRNNNERFEETWTRYKESNFATEQATILAALGCSKSKENIEKLMNRILSDEIRLHDKSATYAAVYQGNLENVDIVLDYILKNSEEWKKTMSLATTLADLSGRFTRYDQFERVIEFTLSAPITGDEKSIIGEALFRNRLNLAWDKARIPEVRTHITRVKADQTRPPPDAEEDNEGLAWWAWTLIIIAILAGVGLLGGGGWYGYKKYYA